MLAVGVVEIVAGRLVAWRPRIGAGSPRADPCPPSPVARPPVPVLSEQV
jgi:hypothetical protein